MKKASAGYLDELPTSATRATLLPRPEWEEKVLKICRESGVGAQFGGKYLVHDVRVIRARAMRLRVPVAIGVSCSATATSRPRSRPRHLPRRAGEEPRASCRPRLPRCPRPWTSTSTRHGQGA
ncbi:MAG: fumarate hydratase [Alistipes sp.]